VVSRLCVVLALLLAACSPAEDVGDGEREVDLNTAIGRGESPTAATVVLPTTSTPTAGESGSTSLPPSTSEAPLPTMSISTTVPSPTTTTAPCAEFDAGAVRLEETDGGWRLVGNRPLASRTHDADERQRSILGGIQLDDDPPLEVVVQAIGIEGPVKATVFDAVGCDLVAVADALTGEVVEFQLGVADLTAGGMICDGREVIQISLQRADLVDSEGNAQVRWEGEAWSRSLFSGLWERQGATQLTVTDEELGEVAVIDCDLG